MPCCACWQRSTLFVRARISSGVIPRFRSWVADPDKKGCLAGGLFNT